MKMVMMTVIGRMEKKQSKGGKKEGREEEIIITNHITPNLKYSYDWLGRLW